MVLALAPNPKEGNLTNTKETTIKVVRDERGRFTKADPTPRPFKVGDVVRMSAAGKRHWAHYYDNPHDGIGVIERVSPLGQLGTRVKWNNGHYNSYEINELELVPSAPKQMKKPEAKKEEAPKFKAGDTVEGLGYNYPTRYVGKFLGYHDTHKDAGKIEDPGSGPWYVKADTIKLVEPAPVFTIQPEAEAAFVALAKALGYQVKKV